MSKFKVGDKVVKADGEKWVTGEKYKKITSENSLLGYTVNRSFGYWEEEELELYKEDKMEKTFKEVIANIKEGEVWKCTREDARLQKIKKINNEITFYFGGYTYSSGVPIDDTFILERSEYTFEEAFKAYEEGKEIESTITHYKIKKIADGKFEVVQGKGSFSSENEAHILVSLKEIKGSWYIND